MERVFGALGKESVNELFYDYDQNLDGFLDVNEVGQMVLKIYGVDVVNEGRWKVWSRFCGFLVVTKKMFKGNLVSGGVRGAGVVRDIVGDVNIEKFDTVSYFQFLRSANSKGVGLMVQAFYGGKAGGSGRKGSKSKGGGDRKRSSETERKFS